MPDPFSLAIITALIAKSTPSWLEALRGTFLDVGKGFAADQGKEMLKKGGTHLRGVFHLDEKEQLRHLQSALDSAVHSGLVRLTSREERDRYRDILTILFESGPHSDTLRRETMRLFTILGAPDVAALNEIYNRSLRFRHLAQSSPPPEVNAAPYLKYFFDALIDELYLDPYFNQHLKDALQTRAALHTAASISDVAVFTQITAAGVTSVDNTLQQMLSLLQHALQKETAPRPHQLDETEGMRQQSREIEAEPPPFHVDQAYKQELLSSPRQGDEAATAAQRDQTSEQRSDAQLAVEQYAQYVEHSFRSFSPVGVVPTGENKPIELQDLLVPQRIVLRDPTSHETRRSFITAELRDVNHMVLLGGPGSGKTLLLRYLAWSHAHAYLSGIVVAASSAIPLLPGEPLPLYIALHRFSEERKRHADCTFLTYVTRLLHNEGVDIRSQLFEELLIQGKMLLLLDGLDEVMTLEERRIIGEEMEQLASRYPGNRILVTSRSVGYELAPLSQKLFLHASLQEFNDEQIEQLLHRWYTYLLGFPVPLPRDAQQEIDALDAVLRENPRLRKLAANPLLLTVLVSLFRYEGLPAKRVLVYDRMADLLLGTWSKLRGTDTRWKEMRMREEDLYLCLAHLGFVFHTHAVAGDDDPESAAYHGAGDLPAASLRREIIAFLQDEKLLSSEAEQYAEAERFLDLVKMEAGLLVERGVNEDGEALYGFVHRSFQEYFAAYHVFGRYLQEGDSSILNDFLRTHLHDPDWQEVILLLLGKLKRKPVTTLLRQLLTGQIKSARSRYTHLLQQDLLFVSTCLAEEITVESQLAGEVISDLCQIVTSSPLPSQKTDALEALHRLMRTKPYAALARSALIETSMQPSRDIPTSMRILEMLDEQGTEGSEGKHISQVFLAWIQNLDFPLKQVLQLVWSWYEKSPQSVEEQQQVIEELQHFQQERDGVEVRQQRVQAISLAVPFSSYADKANAIQAIATLLPQDEAEYCIAAYWRSPERAMEVDEASFVATLTQEKLLPLGIRDDLYRLLYSMVPLFHQESSLE